MDIDMRQVTEGDRLSRALQAVAELARGEVLTLRCGEDPAGLLEDLKRVHGTDLDCQRIRWGIPDCPWLLHVKQSLKPSSYKPA